MFVGTSSLQRVSMCAAIGVWCLLSFRVAHAGVDRQGLASLIDRAAGVAAIVPSDLDTLRLLDTFAGVGDTFNLDLYVVNIDTLGAYAIRIIYDPAVIEPLTDTVVEAGDTLHVIELQQLRGTAFEQFSGTVNEPGLVTMLAADFDADTAEAFAPGSGVSARMAWRVQGLIGTQTTMVVFENDPGFPESFNAITDFDGSILIRPVLTNGAVLVLPGPCNCPFQADFNADNQIDAIDLNALIDLLFFGGANMTDPTCPNSRSDWNCDGYPDAADLNALIDGIFFAPAPPCDPCN